MIFLKPTMLLLFLCSVVATASCFQSESAQERSSSVLLQQSGEAPAPTPSPYKHAWNPEASAVRTIINEIPVPKGAQREIADQGSFALWLRHLPLKNANHKVELYDGERKGNQEPNFRVIDLDVGAKDLQQCADAVMRLRAEYLLESDRESEIAFNYTSGDRSSWSDWRSGLRPKIKGNKVLWEQKGKEDGSYHNFRRYLEKIFTYAGSLSLSKEVKAISATDIIAGDFLILGGSPGHAMMIVDTAVDDNGDVYFLLAQSYMPAQEMHVVRNLNDRQLSPWYKVEAGSEIQTPEWTFSPNAFHRFP